MELLHLTLLFHVHFSERSRFLFFYHCFWSHFKIFFHRFIYNNSWFLGISINLRMLRSGTQLFNFPLFTHFLEGGKLLVSCIRNALFFVETRRLLLRILSSGNLFLAFNILNLNVFHFVFHLLKLPFEMLFFLITLLKFVLYALNFFLIISLLSF